MRACRPRRERREAREAGLGRFRTDWGVGRVRERTSFQGKGEGDREGLPGSLNREWGRVGKKARQRGALGESVGKSGWTDVREGKGRLGFRDGKWRG